MTNPHGNGLQRTIMDGDPWCTKYIRPGIFSSSANKGQGKKTSVFVGCVVKEKSEIKYI